MRQIQYLPFSTEANVPEVCKSVERAAWFHGIGKMNSYDVAAELLVDLESLSELLGEWGVSVLPNLYISILNVPIF